jgi:hypothetical protein
MGYRSEVGLCLDVAGEKTLAETLRNLKTHNEHAGIIQELFAAAEKNRTRNPALPPTIGNGSNDTRAIRMWLLWNLSWKSWKMTITCSSAWVNPMTIPNTGEDFGKILLACVWCGASPLIEDQVFSVAHEYIAVRLC